MRLEELSRAGHLESVNHLIRPAVVCTADLDDPLVLGCASRDTDSRHDGFGTAAEHTEFLNVRHVLVDLFRNQKFSLVEKTGNGTAFLDQLYRLVPYRGEVASQYRGTARLKEIDILVTVNVGQVSTLCFDHTHRERLVECKVVLNSAGDIFFRLGSDRFGFGALFVEVLRYYLVVLVLGNAVDVCIGKLLETFVDLFGVSPSGDAVTCFLFALEFGICNLHCKTSCYLYKVIMYSLTLFTRVVNG